MRLDARAFGFAAGVTAAVVSAVCALAVAVAPDASTQLAGSVVHLDLSGMASPVRVGNFIGRVIFWGTGALVVFTSAVGLYNRLATGSTPRSAAGD